MRSVSLFIWLTLAIVVTKGQAQKADCDSQFTAVKSSLLKPPRFQVSSLGQQPGGCAFSYQDTGISSYPVGTLLIEIRNTPGDLHKDKVECQNVVELGEEARFCQLKDHAYTMFVRRGSNGIFLAFSTWPDGVNTVFSEARKIVTAVLGPYQSAPLQQIALKPSSNPDLDKLETALAASGDKGNAAANVLLGFLLNFPEAPRQPDYQGAAYWYAKAGEEGNAQAQYQLGLLYLNGQGVAKNETEAVRLLKAASDQQYEPALTRYGELVLEDNLYGNGFFYSEPILRKAAALGSADALNDLGFIEWQKLRSTHSEGVYHPDKLFTQAIEKGNCNAYLGLGALYFNGDGVQQDGATARAWFAKAKHCLNASPLLQQKADHWIAMVDSGKLPSNVEEQSMNNGWNDIKSLFTAVVAFGMYENYLHRNDPPKSQAEIDAEIKDVDCNGARMIKAAAMGTAGESIFDPRWSNTWTNDLAACH